MGYGSDIANIIVPARKGLNYVITLDTTARVYDLRTMLFGRLQAPGTNTTNADRVMIRLKARTADLYYHFDSTNTVTLDKTAALAAGGTLIEGTTTYGDWLAAGTWEDVTISRDVDMYLHVQGSAAGYLHMRASSYVG